MIVREKKEIVVVRLVVTFASVYALRALSVRGSVCNIVYCCMCICVCTINLNE